MKINDLFEVIDTFEGSGMGLVHRARNPKPTFQMWQFAGSNPQINTKLKFNKL